MKNALFVIVSRSRERSVAGTKQSLKTMIIKEIATAHTRLAMTGSEFFKGLGMSNKKSLFPLCAVLLSLVMAVAGGQAETKGAPLSLKEAVTAALDKNHALRAQRNSLLAGTEDVGLARSSLLPKISLEERYLKTASPTYAFMTKLNQERIAATDFLPEALNNPDAIDDFQTTLSIEQPLYIRKASIGIEMSQTERTAKEAELGRKKEETAFSVVRAYLMAETAGEYVKAAQKALEDAEEHQRIAETRYGAGLGLYSDTLRAGTAVAGARQQLVTAGKNLQVARMALGLSIGTSDAVDTMPAENIFPQNDPDYYRQKALVRKDIKAMELRRENAVKNIGMAEAGFFPYAGLGGAYQFNDHRRPLGREGYSWQMTAFLRWELFDGTKRTHEKTKAQYQAAEAEEYLEGMKKMILFRVQEAYLSLGEAEKNVHLAREALKTAEEGRRLVKVRYENSLAPLVDLLDAQINFDHARADLVARENEHRLALAALSYESGAILQDLRIEQQTGMTP